MRATARRSAWLLSVLAVGSGVLAYGWPREDPLPDRVDAVVALSAGMQDDTTLYWLGAARLHEAKRIAAQLRAPLVTTNAGRGSEAAQRRIAEVRQVPGDVHSTRDEALAVARAYPNARIVLVTSRYHTRRACAAFERAGLHVTCHGVRTSRWQNVPRDLAYDLAAYVQYRLRGWV